MHVEFLVEELSAEAALRILIPRIRGDITFDVHAHSGKSDLLDKLPGRLVGYKHWLPDDGRIVVLIDEDRDDCHAQKARLESVALAAGFSTRTTAPPPRVHIVVNRLAVEELEAWFLGDVPALVAAYARVSPHLGKQAPYRNPDAVAGGTWEALERVLRKAGYHKGGLPKIEAARAIAAHMDPSRNRSKSFQVFRDALITL